MNRQGKRKLIISICSALNGLFVMGSIVFKGQWKHLPDWVYYLFLFLMIVNAGILIACCAISKE